MVKWFKMPNGELIETERVMAEGLLVDWYPGPYLAECLSEREWTGKPSTTQLLNGTRLAYLQILTDYAVDPDDQAFRIVGTRGHGKLELNADESMFAETKFSEGEVTGVADLLEPDPADPGAYILTDYKVWGSYKVGKALGVVKKQRPMVDGDGNPVVYQKAGSKTVDGKKVTFNAGDPRTEDYYDFDPTKRDIPEAELQVNNYRLLAERFYGVRISRMRIFIPVRDGGTYVAKNRGITRNTYSVAVPMIADKTIEAYFDAKRDALVGAMEGYRMSIDAGHDHDRAVADNMPQACSKLEAWDGRRCAAYCPVAAACVKAGNPYIQPGDIEDLEGGDE